MRPQPIDRRIDLALVALACVFAGCAHYPQNAPLEQVDATSGYRIRATAGDADDSTELAFVLTLSGGGTRAAAFAYGVLAALRDIEVEFDGGRRSLVGEIDGISSVSAGSVRSVSSACASLCRRFSIPR